MRFSIKIKQLWCKKKLWGPRYGSYLFQFKDKCRSNFVISYSRLNKNDRWNLAQYNWYQTAVYGVGGDACLLGCYKQGSCAVVYGLQLWYIQRAASIYYCFVINIYNLNHNQHRKWPSIKAIKESVWWNLFLQIQFIEICFVLHSRPILHSMIATFVLWSGGLGFAGLDPLLVWRRPTRREAYQRIPSLQPPVTLAEVISNH